MENRFSQQGSLHYTPEHCLVNGGVPFILVENATCFNWLQHEFLLRSPAQTTLTSTKKGGIYHEKTGFPNRDPYIIHLNIAL